MDNQSGRVVLIGGVTGGIGSALARQLHASGWTVAGFARNPDRLASIADELPGLATFPVDARDPAGIEAACRSVHEVHGRFDAYVHAVGSIFLKAAHLTSPAEFATVIQDNLQTAFNGLRAAIVPLQAAGGGSIVLISSVAAKVGLPNHEAIAAAKAGIEGLARAAAATYAPRSVRVNCVAPGLVETPLSAPMLASEQARLVSERMHPLGRIGQAGEIAALIGWLLSPEASWVTGQSWSIDGGLADARPRPRA